MSEETTKKEQKMLEVIDQVSEKPVLFDVNNPIIIAAAIQAASTYV